MSLSDPTDTVERREIVVVGASAGGVEALAEFASHLPAALPAAILIVLHMPAYGHSVLPEILSRRGAMPAKHAEDGEMVRPGYIYVAPPDHHLLIKDDRILLTRGPAENNHRPAVDTLFRSAARCCGSRVIGIVLTGTLDDGTSGLRAIKTCGGMALVQDPEEALFTGMPRSAIENVAVDGVQTIAALAGTVVRLAGEPLTQKGSPVTAQLEEDVAVARMKLDALTDRQEGEPSAFSCPDCHGVLWEIAEGQMVRYRCRVGHAYSPQSLLASQSDNLEEALWVALRALEESAAMAERLQERAAERGHKLSAKQFSEQARDARSRATIVHEALRGGQIIARPSSLPPDSNPDLKPQESDFEI